jgi:hypothetical protein
MGPVYSASNFGTGCGLKCQLNLSHSRAHSLVAFDYFGGSHRNLGKCLFGSIN